MDRTAEQIEDLRLKELQKQAAMYGPNTEPAILIEIQELTHKQRVIKGPTRREFVNQLDYDFLMNVVAAALMRLGAVESSLQKDDRKRITRQLVHDLWMITITVIVVLTLLLQLLK